MKAGLQLLLLFIALLWTTHLANAMTDYSLNAYGIMPRARGGLWGIPLSPLLHKDWSHLASNTLPLLALGGLVAARGARTLAPAALIIILLGGLGVWIAGRSAIHIGASGLVFGLFGYLVALGWYERSPLSIIVAIAVVAVYGGIIFGALPQSGFISWEAHLFGLMAGVVAAAVARPGRG